jgi:hypothetical protein
MNFPVGILRKESRRTPPLRTGFVAMPAYTIMTGDKWCVISIRQSSDRLFARRKETRPAEMDG